MMEEKDNILDLIEGHIYNKDSVQFKLKGALVVWIAALNGECIGHVRLSIEYNKIKYHDAWVHPDYRRQGIYTMLWKARDTYAKQHFAGQKAMLGVKQVAYQYI